MIGFKLRGRPVQMFNPRAVVSPKERATRHVLSRFGSFVRRTARSSIRKRKRVSGSGDPPSSHEGGLRRLLLFAFDMAAQSVVVGPLLYRSGVAELLEEGGQAVRRGKRVSYEPRPFMGPAYQENLPKVPSLWRDSIK
ncbi:hypothetical protein CA54_16860 [Symmachiella macrocystis]|uniref:Uncharacterized protein n=1 Tax=Symmachiella macrocystis TaxID=2527985 RepID=A0A5C6BL84_9PLAN|nr:hypothetical protein [Symmachiella macrocystis]TWU12860.1 hypothetical protein CA54_16860 [Symmachiella macrocystis]